MSTPAAAPEWLMGLAGLDAGAKLALIGLRSFGPFDPAAAGVFVFPSRASLAQRIGQKENTIKGQLKRLTKLEIIAATTRKVDDEQRKGWTIADRAQCESICRGLSVPEPGSRGTHGSPGTRVTSDPTMGHEVPDPGSLSTQARVSGDPLNLQGSCFDLPVNVEERATPDDSKANPDEISSTHNHEHPALEPQGTGATRDAAGGPRGPGADLRGRTADPRGGGASSPGADLAHGDRRADRRQDHDRHDDRHDRGVVPAGPSPDAPAHEPLDFEQRIKRASASAYSSLLSSGRTLAAVDAKPVSRDWSWAAGLRKAQLDLDASDDHVITAFETWEKTDRDDKPSMGQIWRYDQRKWLKSAMGIRPRGRALAPGQQTAAEIDELIKRSSMGVSP